jgi:pimeloyl-[acyl-carrier protein] methyl ester esterase
VTTIWLPGWSAPASIWSPAIAAMPEREHRTVEWTACTAPQELLERARQALPAHGPVRLVGWSMGGMLALELARLLPERVLDVHVIGTAAGLVRPAEPDGWHPAAVTRMRRRLLASGGTDEFDEALWSPLERAEGWPARWRASRGTADPAALLAGLDFLAQHHLEQDSQVVAPVRLLHGGLDAICPPAAGQRLADLLPHGSLTLWPDCGHAPFFSRRPSSAVRTPSPSGSWRHEQGADPPRVRPARGRL